MALIVWLLVASFIAVARSQDFKSAMVICTYCPQEFDTKPLQIPIVCELNKIRCECRTPSDAKKCPVRMRYIGEVVCDLRLSVRRMTDIEDWHTKCMYRGCAYPQAVVNENDLYLLYYSGTVFGGISPKVNHRNWTYSWGDGARRAPKTLNFQQDRDTFCNNTFNDTSKSYKFSDEAKADEQKWFNYDLKVNNFGNQPFQKVNIPTTQNSEIRCLVDKKLVEPHTPITWYRSGQPQAKSLGTVVIDDLDNMISMLRLFRYDETGIFECSTQARDNTYVTSPRLRISHTVAEDKMPSPPGSEPCGVDREGYCQNGGHCIVLIQYKIVSCICQVGSFGERCEYLSSGVHFIHPGGPASKRRKVFKAMMVKKPTANSGGGRRSNNAPPPRNQQRGRAATPAANWRRPPAARATVPPRSPPRAAPRPAPPSQWQQQRWRQQLQQQQQRQQLQRQNANARRPGAAVPAKVQQQKKLPQKTTQKPKQKPQNAAGARGNRYG